MSDHHLEMALDVRDFVYHHLDQLYLDHFHFPKLTSCKQHFSFAATLRYQLGLASDHLALQTISGKWPPRVTN